MVQTITQKIVTFLFCVQAFTAAPFLIIGTAHASPENDRIYSLESLGWFKTIDNVDGIFAPYVDDVYKKYFDDQTRFQVRPLTVVDDVLSKSKIPFSTLVKDNDVIRKIALKFRVESILRTQVFKEGDTYRFVMDWVFAPRGDVLATNEFRFLDPKKESGLRGDELPAAIRKGLDDLIAKLPFLGQITGVDGDTVTVNMGRNQGVKEGQTLGVYSLQALKRHPLNKSIEEWRWSPIGKIHVDQVDESLLFGKVSQTEPNQRILRYQKVREVIDPPTADAPVTADGKPIEAKKEEYNYDRLGYVAGNLGIGSYAREANNNTVSRGGSGWQANFELEAAGWLNSHFMAEISAMAGIINYSPTNLATEADIGTSYSGTMTQFRLAAGYSLLEVKTIYDPAVILKLGYRNIAYSLASTTTDLTGSSSVGGIFVGVGAQVPVREGFGLLMGIDLNLLRSLTQESPRFGEATSDSDLMFMIGGTYQFAQRIVFRGLFRFNAQSGDFPGGKSVNQKLISFCPSVAFTF